MNIPSNFYISWAVPAETGSKHLDLTPSTVSHQAVTSRPTGGKKTTSKVVVNPPFALMRESLGLEEDSEGHSCPCLLSTHHQYIELLCKVSTTLAEVSTIAPSFRLSTTSSVEDNTTRLKSCKFTSSEFTALSQICASLKEARSVSGFCKHCLEFFEVYNVINV